MMKTGCTMSFIFNFQNESALLQLLTYEGDLLHCWNEIQTERSTSQSYLKHLETDDSSPTTEIA
jgi:hypothetical protein